jgi:hypothetical protein
MKQRLSALVWNLRFNLAHRILPGVHKHVLVTDRDELCPRCELMFAEIAEHNENHAGA